MTHTETTPLDLDRDDVYFCPHCGRLTRHSVTRERVLVPVLWCLSCFHTHMGENDSDPSASVAESSPVSQAGA